MNPGLSRNFVSVLLVEDSWGDVLLMRQALRDANLPFHLNIVTDGEDALDFLNREGKYSGAFRPDLVVLDLNLPRMDGRIFLRRIKENPVFQNIPVVILTSSQLDSDIREAQGLNADSYMVKPIDLNGFLRIARNLWDFWFKWKAVFHGTKQ